MKSRIKKEEMMTSMQSEKENEDEIDINIVWDQSSGKEPPTKVRLTVLATATVGTSHSAVCEAFDLNPEDYKTKMFIMKKGEATLQTRDITLKAGKTYYVTFQLKNQAALPSTLSAAKSSVEPDSQVDRGQPIRITGHVDTTPTRKPTSSPATDRVQALVNVLHDPALRHKHKLGDQAVEFIIPSQKLEVRWASVEEFFGIMIRPAYVQLATAIISTQDNICLKGTPGIGKSMFALYVIYLFITDESPETASIWKDWIHLVYDCGLSHVFHFTRGNKQFTREARHKFQDEQYNSSTTIHLADGFAFDSLKHRLGGRLIYISSSNFYSQARISKNIIIQQLFMPVWSLSELVLCNQVLHLVTDDSTVELLYSYFGGCPRFVLYYASRQGPVKLIEEQNQKILNNNPEQVIDYIAERKYTTDVTSSLIHYVVSPDFQSIVYTFASSYIQSRLMISMERGQKKKLVRFIKNSSGVGLYQQMRGDVFEMLAHEYIACPNNPLPLKPKSIRDKVECTLQRPTITHKFLEPAENQNNQQRLKNDLSEFVRNAQNPELVYFQPLSKSYGTIDAFSLPNVFYQMTVSKTHSLTITKDFLVLFEIMREHKPDLTTCIFVWVLPDDVFAEFVPPNEISYSFPVTDEEKGMYGRMIKQFKMEICMNEELWENLTNT